MMFIQNLFVAAGAYAVLDYVVSRRWYEYQESKKQHHHTTEK
jgi:hypothetical protein